MPKPALPATPPTLTLDAHSRQFFDPHDSQGPVEATFGLDVRGLERSVFVGRMARFCTGQALMVLRVAGGEGTGEKACFVRRVPLIPGATWDREEVSRLWKALFSLGEVGRPGGDRLPLLPELSACGGLGRLHYDVASGFGCALSDGGDCALFDLRDVVGARRPVAVVELGDLVCPQGMASLVAMDGDIFHARMAAQLRDAGTALCQAVRFYGLSDEGRSREVFGCSWATLRCMIELLRLALLIEMGPSGALNNLERTVWRPFAGDREAMEGWSREQQGMEAEVPARLRAWIEQICAALGCGMRPGDGGHGHAVALEWAGGFAVRGALPSAHEAMEAAGQLRDTLDR